jgi:hypothetical protein
MADFSIEFQGLDTFKGKVGRMGKVMNRSVRADLAEFALLAEEVIKGLAPYDTGELERSISASRVTRNGRQYVVSVGTNMEYAVIVHERPTTTYGYRDKYAKGVRFKNYYINGRGRRTLEKAKVRGMRPGRKFMTNGVTVLEGDWKAMYPSLMEKILRT